MKRCPKCGLVHSDLDNFCRRCKIDLLTGEPISIPTQSPKYSSELNQLDIDFILKKISGVVSWSQERIQKNPWAQKLKTRFRLSPAVSKSSAQVEELIYCLNCGGEMKPSVLSYFPLKSLYPLLGVAVILLVLSFFFWALIFPALLSMAGFFFYRALKLDLWVCSECKSQIKRQKPKK